MKTKNQNEAFFTVLTLLFTSVLTLTGCGLKGRLYQTPDAAPSEKVITEAEITSSAISNTKVNTEKNNNTQNDQETLSS